MNPEAFAAALAEELDRLEVFELELSGHELLQIVLTLQVALQHPAFNGADLPLQLVRGFIERARQAFEGFPSIQMTIDKTAGAAHRGPLN